MGGSGGGVYVRPRSHPWADPLGIINRLIFQQRKTFGTYFLAKLYHFTVAYEKGKATDPIKYFTDPSNQDLAVVKVLRKPLEKLELSPFPLPLNAKIFLT